MRTTRRAFAFAVALMPGLALSDTSAPEPSIAVDDDEYDPEAGRHATSAPRASCSTCCRRMHRHACRCWPGASTCPMATRPSRCGRKARTWSRVRSTSRPATRSCNGSRRRKAITTAASAARPAGPRPRSPTSCGWNRTMRRPGNTPPRSRRPRATRQASTPRSSAWRMRAAPTTTRARKSRSGRGSSPSTPETSRRSARTRRRRRHSAPWRPRCNAWRSGFRAATTRSKPPARPTAPPNRAGAASTGARAPDACSPARATASPCASSA